MHLSIPTCFIKTRSALASPQSKVAPKCSLWARRLFVQHPPPSDPEPPRGAGISQGVTACFSGSPLTPGSGQGVPPSLTTWLSASLTAAATPPPQRVASSTGLTTIPFPTYDILRRISPKGRLVGGNEGIRDGLKHTVGW